MMTKIQVAITASLAFAACLLVAGVSCSESAGRRAAISLQAAAIDELKQRPLNLPQLKANEPCPVSHGRQDLVRNADYVFCSSCFWFGKGPAYLALSWSDQHNDEARFALTRVPREQHAYIAKTPWVAKPDYSGSILVRGRRLDGSGGEKLRFSWNGSKPSETLELDAPPPGRNDPAHWSFWPTGMYVPRAGCFGLQIDTKDGTDVVVFEAGG